MIVYRLQRNVVEQFPKGIEPSQHCPLTVVPVVTMN